MKKKIDLLSEALTRQAFRGAEEDIYSSEERAKAEQIIDIVLDHVTITMEETSLKADIDAREALIQKIESFL